MSGVSPGEGGEQDSRTASQDDSPSQAAQQNANDVIPIEELDGPARRQLDSVCPGSPADHAEQHECELGGIGFRQERDKASLGDALSGTRISCLTTLDRLEFASANNTNRKSGKSNPTPGLLFLLRL